ncbi:Uma2 family endonuclease [Streptomyces sp. NPDC097640]|uniref:Uma2 family endonuclease n=1 Tax=Streptomyces sp. NPDC097640 TaxID=3157229 RepID=UPI0033213FD4
MTVELTERIEMAESGKARLDDMFELLERMPVPEGYKVEIVEGVIHMSPQRRTHWKIIRRVMQQLEDRFGRDADIDVDVRIDFPGYLNGFCPDLAKIAEGAVPDERGNMSYRDVEFVLEVISRGTGRNDYGPKRDTYAVAGVPVYLIADPYQRQCHVFTEPKGDEYRSQRTVDFGEPIDLTGTVVDLVISTEHFPHD